MRWVYGFKIAAQLKMHLRQNANPSKHDSLMDVKAKERSIKYRRRAEYLRPYCIVQDVDNNPYTSDKNLYLSDKVW